MHSSKTGVLAFFEAFSGRVCLPATCLTISACFQPSGIDGLEDDTGDATGGVHAMDSDSRTKDPDRSSDAEGDEPDSNSDEEGEEGEEGTPDPNMGETKSRDSTNSPETGEDSDSGEEEEPNDSMDDPAMEETDGGAETDSGNDSDSTTEGDMEAGEEEGDPVKECIDPAKDCDEPSNVCKEAYCDDADKCAERSVENGTQVSEWVWDDECEWANECIETAPARKGTREICENGRVVEETETVDCERDTDGTVLEKGKWRDDGDGACKAEDDGSGNCVERRYRDDEVCEEGKQVTKELSEKCDRSTQDEYACNFCGNGFVEAGEICEPDDFCRSDCKKRIVYVRANGSGRGTSWTDATDLQAGLNTAGNFADDGDPVEVWVRDDTYSIRGSGVNLPAGIEVYGGFDGSETNRSGRDENPINTVLDGGGSATHVLVFTEAGAQTKVDGFTIRGGNANGTGIDDDGGGIVCQPSSGTAKLYLENLIIEDNSASSAGAGVSINRSEVVFGGNIRFEGNDARYGGGVFLKTSASLTVEGDVDFHNNSSVEGGGALRCSTGGSVQIDSGAVVNMTSNKALVNGEGWGGAIRIFNSCDMVVSGSGTKVNLLNNEAIESGGGIHMAGSGTTISVKGGAQMYFEGNKSQNWGGGFRNQSSAKFSVDAGSLVSGKDNTAVQGGGFYNSGTLEGDFSMLLGTPSNKGG